MELAGYIASLFIGILLGLIGSGGSILTLPVLVYLFKIEPVLASAYSLFIVGFTSLIGTFPKYKNGTINIQTAIIFGLPAIITVYLTRAYIVPFIPNEILNLGSIMLTKPLLLMLLFALLMIFASVSMVREEKVQDEEETGLIKYNYPLILIEGSVVGVLTGLVGAGGGFLIIPALVLLSKLPMKQAIGTSLLIIAAKSLIGFTGDIGNQIMDWGLLLSITGLAIIGIVFGNMLSKHLPAVTLKKMFGWFLLLMGNYIIVKELFF